MQNDPSAPSALPSKGFASILSLVSDVSQDLVALEQAAAEPPQAPPPRPKPVRFAPEPAAAIPPAAAAAASVPAVSQLGPLVMHPVEMGKLTGTPRPGTLASRHPASPPAPASGTYTYKEVPPTVTWASQAAARRPAATPAPTLGLTPLLKFFIWLAVLGALIALSSLKGSSRRPVQQRVNSSQSQGTPLREYVTPRP